MSWNVTLTLSTTLCRSITYTLQSLVIIAWLTKIAFSDSVSKSWDDQSHPSKHSTLVPTTRSVGYFCYNLVSRYCLVYCKQCWSFDSFGIVVVAPTRILRFRFVGFFFNLLTLLVTLDGASFFEWRKITQKNIWRSHISSLEHSTFSSDADMI